MLTRVLRNQLAAPIGVILLAVAGCSSPAGPSPQSTLSVAGSWLGIAQLPNAYQAIFSLQQSASAVSGTIRITGATATIPLSGTVASDSRTFTWRASYNCEIWNGVLTIAGDARAMDGPLTIDRSGCAPAQNSGSGTLSLNKQ